MRVQVRSNESSLIKDFPDPAEYLIGFTWTEAKNNVISNTKIKEPNITMNGLKSFISKRTISPGMNMIKQPGYKKAFKILAKKDKLSYDLVFEDEELLSKNPKSEVYSERKESLSPTNKPVTLTNKDIILLTKRIKRDNNQIRDVIYKAKFSKLSSLKKNSSPTESNTTQKLLKRNALSTDKEEIEKEKKKVRINIESWKNSKFNITNRINTKEEYRIRN